MGLFASTPFIGGCGKDFSHFLEIYFWTLLLRCDAECFKAMRAVLRSESIFVATRCSDLSRFEAGRSDSWPRKPCRLRAYGPFCRWISPRKEKALRLAPKGLWNKFGGLATLL